MEYDPSTDEKFSKIREVFWPIYNHELKKFLPMGIIMFCILYNYTILRDTKDSLVVPAVGAEVLPFLKSLVVMPASVLFVVLYTKLVNTVRRQTLFISIIAAFILFFGAFAFYLYPNKEILHPSLETVQELKEAYPHMEHIISIYAVWTYSIFYALSELWGSITISLLFWQFANEITHTREAKRFYAMFGLLANFSLIISGQTVRYFANISKTLTDADAWGTALNYMMSAVVLSGIIVILIYKWMNTKVLTDPRFYKAVPKKTDQKQLEDKPKLSVIQSFKYLFSSKYLGCIALLVLCYGLSINLIELVWKDQVRKLVPDPNDYGAFMGGFSMMTGAMTIILILLFKGIVAKFGWKRGAIITPCVVGLTGAAFFAFILFQTYFDAVLATLRVTALSVAVYFGAFQNILSKATKYSLFDPTKEMAYIPLNQELKTKGKAAVDVIGGRLGKAGGGYLAGALLFGHTLAEIQPILAAIVGIAIVIWIGAVQALSKMYDAKIASES